jgi:hypothetical protein
MMAIWVRCGSGLAAGCVSRGRRSLTSFARSVPRLAHLMSDPATDVQAGQREHEAVIEIARDLKVQIIGDASGYSRALAQATGATAGFGSGLSRVAKTRSLGCRWR